jgi:hypothetical protein
MREQEQVGRSFLNQKLAVPKEIMSEQRMRCERLGYDDVRLTEL